MPVLLDVCHQRSSVPAAQKNAAIALARMAQHPTLMTRLQELRGLEKIHAYVKI